MRETVTCAVCGQQITGERENVYLVRHVQLMDGRSGWIAAHVRCARGPWPSSAARVALRTPPGSAPALPMLTAGVCS